MATVKKGTEMESHVFQKAKTKEEYLGFVARLILHVRELSSGNTMLGGLPPPPGPQQPNPPNPLMPGMNPRPVLQQKLTTGMQRKMIKTQKDEGQNQPPEEIRTEEIYDGDTFLDELDVADVAGAVNMKKRTFSEMCREACGLLRAVNKKLDAKDEFHVFGDHVAMKLRSLTSERAKNVAQYHINTVLFEALTGKYDAPSPQNSISDQGSPSGLSVNSYMSSKTSIMSSKTNMMSSRANTISPQTNMMSPLSNMKVSSPTTQNSSQYVTGDSKPSMSSSPSLTYDASIYSLSYDEAFEGL